MTNALRRADPPTDLPLQVEPETWQHEAWRALMGPATHILAYGGSGSGKTHTILTWLLIRGLARPRASQTILRFHFTDLRTSIVPTLWLVQQTHWPHDPDLFTINKSTLEVSLRGGGRIYLGGLDDAKRTEKILGQEHSTIYLNEASQISVGARAKALTRLRQRAGLRHKEVVDENPPQQGHWTELEWVKGIDPATKKAFDEAGRRERVAVRMHPANNPHIPESYKQRLRNMSPRERERFWDGNFGSGTSNPLWTVDSIEDARIEPSAVPESIRIAVVCDPSGCSGPEDKRSDEVGISVVGVSEGVVYVLEDASGRLGPDGPNGWGAKLIQLWCKWGADFVAAEKNFGGEMVAAVVRSAVAKYDGRTVEGTNVPYRPIVAAHGKTVRADPVATLTTRGKVKFAGHFPELELQLCCFSSSGYVGERSPDRADAFVHGAYALGLIPTPGQGILDYYRQESEALSPKPPSADGAPISDLTDLSIATRFAGSSHAMGPVTGTAYGIENGRVRVKPEDVERFLHLGFTRIAA